MKQIINVLFCSIAFPPKNDPESLQVGRYYNELIKHQSLSIDILTSKNPTLYMPVDESLSLGQKSLEKCTEVRIYENKYTNYLIRRLGFSFIDKPDSKFTFILNGKNKIKNLNRPDILYSRAFPISSLIMGYFIQKKFNCPWVLHLSDPWSWSPIINFSNKLKSWHKKWEEKCFESATIICLTSIPTIERYKKIYPQFENKFRYFPNVYSDDKGHVPQELSKKLRLTYTGGLAGNRSPIPFLEAVKTLLSRNPDFEKLIEITFAGPIDRQNKAYFNNYKHQCVQHIGNLSYSQAKELQKNSDVLIVIDNEIRNDDEAVFFPSKLLDYFTSKKRILSITTKNSCTEKILLNQKADICYRNNILGIAQAIEKAMKMFQKGDKEYFLNNMEIEQYSASYNAKRLINEFQSLMLEQK